MTTEQIKDAYTLSALRAMGNQLGHLSMRVAEHLEEIASLQAERDDLVQRVKDLEAQRVHWIAAEHRVSAGYVRLRQIIGAMNPPAFDWGSLSQYVEGVAREVVDERTEAVRRVFDLEIQAVGTLAETTNLQNERDVLIKRGSEQVIQTLDALSKVSDLQAENEELKAKLERIERLIRSEEHIGPSGFED